MWRGHRGPAVIGVLSARDGGENIDARRAQMNGGGAVIGESGKIVTAVCGGDADQIRGVVRRGIVRRTVIVRSVVAGGRDKQHVVRARLVDLIEQALRKARAAPTV